jgi:hypothetical protein
LTISNS